MSSIGIPVMENANALTASLISYKVSKFIRNQSDELLDSVSRKHLPGLFFGDLNSEYFDPNYGPKSRPVS